MENDIELTHLTRCCPHCGSLKYKKKKEYNPKVNGKTACTVNIFWLCEKCHKQFTIHGQIEVETRQAFNRNLPYAVIEQNKERKAQKEALKNNLQ